MSCFSSSGLYMGIFGHLWSGNSDSLPEKRLEHFRHFRALLNYTERNILTQEMYLNLTTTPN